MFLCGMHAWLLPREISLPLCYISQLKAFQKVMSCLICQWNKKFAVAQANAERKVLS